MKLREVEDEAVGDYLAAKCTVGRPRWTSGLWSAVMPTVCYGTYTYTYIYIYTQRHTQTKSTKYARTKECIHYATPSFWSFESNYIADCAHKYTVYINTHTLALPLGCVSNIQFAHCSDTYHK